MATDTSAAFQHLHKLLQELTDAEYMLGHGPKRIASSEKKVRAGEAACAEQKDHIQQLRKKADEAALNLKTKEADIAKQAGRLNEATSNKEYEIIQGQIDSLKSACEKLEDQILAMLGDVDDATEGLSKQEKEVGELKDKLQAVREEVQSREPGLKTEIDRLESEIKEAETVIPSGVPRSTYLRLKLSQGAAGMSKVEGGYCEECNTGVTPQDAIRLNLGEFLLCRACGRILYTAEED